ncbi:cytochrome c [Azorhizobium oxalatiphilum]|uniref:Cytochrome c n=1 Tax=Azorhizobium oxalatiphilum TaxID=980631 RepID=A0A917CCF2_9HYPH|nr:cytochrome c [Azorhizobium oxalatiphilum]GGF78762.1 cytochrome c [Azorhizobium oxalatiphilum]
MSLINKLRAALAAAAMVTVAVPAVAQQFPDSVVERGRYLATASDCTACHTNTGGKPMAGGHVISSPVGGIVATNITPSKSFGIGTYTETQFADAVRKGVLPDGTHLFPAMPYTAYAVMTDEDIHALYAYFMQAVTPVDEALTAKTDLPFPLNIRLSMFGWNLLFANAKPFVADPARSAEWNRGRYLVEGAAHCGTCHTPRGIFMQEKTDQPLAGAQVGPWFAPNITKDKTAGIGSWSHDELVTYLKTGRLVGKAQAAGSMGEAITHSFTHMTDADLSAMATYVLDLPASPAGAVAGGTRFDQGKAGNELAGFRGEGFAKGMKGPKEGAQIYSANCASCHGYNAQGTTDAYYPSLFSNSATGGPNAANLVATILFGVDRETGHGHVFMPPFGGQPNAVTSLTNAEVASLSNYVLKTYGNSTLTVTPAEVQTIRIGGPQSDLLLMARVGMGAGAAVALIAALVLLVYGLRRRRPAAPAPTGV